jgi:peroxiredoxin
VRQVADFQAHMDEFRNENIDVIALSVDPVDKAKEMVERTSATFPIAYGLKVPEDATKVGAYWEERRGIIHATNFTLDSAHKILQACFATGPIGRITAADALSSIRGTKKRKAQGG